MKEEKINEITWKIVDKYWPASGCSNCWGDLHEGCTDACRNSSFENGRKFDEVKAILKELL